MRPVRPAAYWSRTGFLRIRAVFRADAAICHSFSGDRELWAVAALRLAGFSAGIGDCARGGCSAGAGRLSRGAVFVLCRSCVIGMSCARSRPSYVPAEMFYARSRLLFAACAPNRTACGMFRSCSAVGRDRHSCVLESSVRLSGFLGSLRACAFFYGDPDGERRNAENGVGGEVQDAFA